MVFEGDQLLLTCSINSSLPSTDSVELILKHGTDILNEGFNEVNYSLVVKAEGPADFQCELELNSVVKKTSNSISVAGELTVKVEFLVQLDFKVSTNTGLRFKGVNSEIQS